MSAPPPDDLVAGRSCGACRACCQVFLIEEPELSKPAGVMCGHAGAGGCGIYERRPAPCRAFHCAWRQSEALPEEARPDRLGVMFWVTGRPSPQTVFDTLSLVGAAVSDPAALATPQVQALIAQLSGGALPIHLRWGDQQQLVHPAPDLAGAIASGDRQGPLVQQAAAWLARYLPLAENFAGERAVRPPGC